MIDAPNEDETEVSFHVKRTRLLPCSVSESFILSIQSNFLQKQRRDRFCPTLGLIGVDSTNISLLDNKLYSNYRALPNSYQSPYVLFYLLVYLRAIIALHSTKRLFDT